MDGLLTCLDLSAHVEFKFDLIATLLSISAVILEQYTKGCGVYIAGNSGN